MIGCKLIYLKVRYREVLASLKSVGSEGSAKCAVNHHLTLRGGPLAVPLILLLTATVMAQEEQAIPLEPIHVTAPWPLTPPQYKEVSKIPYPEQARGRQEYGTVLLLVKVLPTGSVGELKITKSSGYSLLDDAALKGAKDWTFVPARRGPKAVEALVEIPVRFELVE